jgi:hypothetical protein
MAWICEYVVEHPQRRGTTRTPHWSRHGTVAEVPVARLAALAEDMQKLKPADADRICTADFGPRWMLVYAHGSDLTGLVVDGFGCRDIRLSDDPFETVPGDSRQHGVVRGVLSGPARLLELVGAR